MLPFDQADIHGVNFWIVTDFHNGTFLEIERIDGDNNYFVGFLFDDRRNLFDRVQFLLPRFAKAEVETAKFAVLLGRFPCAFANGLNYFGFRCAAFQALFAGMVG